MRRRARTVLTAAISAALLAATAVAATTANAASGPICEQYGSTSQGNYVVMNNKWNPAATGQQCIDVTTNGFRITAQPNSVPTNGAPTSYPAIYVGCHYTVCSANTPLPKQISSIGSIDSSISWTYASGTFDAAYDIWLDSSPKRDGVNQTEIMIWFNRSGAIQPIGSAVGTATVNGRSWEVWTGNNGQNNVVSYVADSAISSWSFDTLNFIRDTLARGSYLGNTNWYLTSIQAGFEPWTGGVGLAVNSFSVAVNGGTPPSSAPPSSPPPTTAGCSATHRVVSSWSGGFQGEVTVKNTGSSALNGWTVTWPSGSHTVTQYWSTTVSLSGSTYTAKPVSWNSTIGAGASTTFGFVATGAAGVISPSCSAG